MHNDPMHRTDTLNPNKDFIGGKQKRHWSRVPIAG